jgi:transmembrane sensor
MHHEIDWDLILKYLEGDCTSEDEKKLKEWLYKDEYNREKLDRLSKIWNIPDNPLPEPDVEKTWQGFKENISTGGTWDKNLPPFEMQIKKANVIEHLFRSRLLKIAAVFLIIVLTSYLFFKPNKFNSLNEIIVDRAQTIIITLPDDTRVTLDAGSTLRYPDRFGEQERQVYLNGEGFFEVTASKETPFYIHTAEAAISVLGTKFNVRAWQQNKKVTLTVLEGKVSFQPENVDDPMAKVIVSRGQYSEIIENSYPSNPQYIDTKRNLSWLDREMYFQNVPLLEVLDQLERWYDLEIILTDVSIANNRVTIFIEPKEIEEILEVISLMNNIRYKRNGKEIVFFNK